MFVALVNPGKINVARVSTGPIEALNSQGRILCRFDDPGIPPLVSFSVTIHECDGADVAVEDGERIHPTGRGFDINDPCALVIAAWVGLLEKGHSVGRS